jgi:NADPH-dependent 2,4-dienoyl-CoA reductase/sulfur reductase-like enzyme
MSSPRRSAPRSVGDPGRGTAGGAAHVDPELGRLVRERIEKAGVEVVTGVSVDAVHMSGARPDVIGSGGFRREADPVLVVVGVRPDTALAQTAGAELGARGAIAVDRSSGRACRTSGPRATAR